MEDKMRDKVMEEKSLLSALHELSREEFTLSDKTILDKLYVQIEATYFAKGTTACLHLVPQLGHWMEIIFEKWNESDIFYGVKVFAVRLAGLIGSSSEGLEILSKQNLLSNLHKLVMTPEIQNDSYIMVSIISTFGTFLNHQDGWNWVTETSIWKHIVKACHEDHSINIRRAAVQFITLLLKMSAEFNSEVGIQIMCEVSEPLIMNNLLIVGKHNELENPGNSTIYIEKYTNPIETLFSGDTVIASVEMLKSAKLLTDILENAILTDACLPGKFTLIFRPSLDIREAEFGVGSIHESVILTDILNNCSKLQDHQTYSLLLLMVNLNDSSRKKYNVGLKQCNLYITYEHIYSIINSMICKNFFHAVNNFCIISLYWCAKMKQNTTCWYSVCVGCKTFETIIVHCLSIYLLLNAYCFRDYVSKEFLKTSKRKIAKSYLVEKLSNKILIECLANDTKKQSSQYTLLGVMGLSRILNFVKGKSNIVAILTDVTNTVHFLTTQLKDHQPVVNPIMLHLLTLSTELVEKHQLQFDDVVEKQYKLLFLSIIKILSACYDVRITTTSLQLLCKMLQIHTIPEILSSGEERKPNKMSSEFNKLPILISKLNCPSWEIRDTIIEVFQTVVEFTELTPWLLNGLFRSAMLEKIYEVARNDESGYVRASALIFFSKTVLAKRFSHLISPSKLLELAENATKTDELPNARQAACQLMTSLYISYVPQVLNDSNAIYEAMFDITTRELDWEVKRLAVIFWRCVIDKLLMEDAAGADAGASLPPSCSKLLATYNYSSINKVLNTLGEIGCLKAIWLGINDECDIKVSEEAQKLVYQLLELDTTWNFTEKQIGESALEETKEDIQNRNIRALNPKVFFTLIKTENWKEKLNSRQDWLENSCDDLNSLLDLILNVDNKPHNIDCNAIDCY